jgi:hypothetical protein
VVLDNQKEIADSKSVAKGTKDAETAESITWRTASLARWADKKQLKAVAHTTTDKSDASVQTDSALEADLDREGGPLSIQATPIQSIKAHRKRQQATTNKGSNSFDKDFKRLVDHVVQKEKASDKAGEKTVVKRLDGLEAGLSKILILLRRGG